MITLFTGCSFTTGFGFELGADEPGLWVNLLHRSEDFKHTKLVNAAIPAASNEEIFHSSVDNILKYKPGHAFVQWSEAPRYNVMLGVETYSTTQHFGIENPCQDHNLHSINYPASYLSKVRDRFLSLEHPHQCIVNILKYTNVLINLAKVTNTKIFFVNGMSSWDDQYFTKLNNVLPSEYTPYTQKILELSTRDDSEAFALYDKIHHDYDTAGGIQTDHWINLYNSFADIKIDTNLDHRHPGIKSNQLYFDIVKKFLTNRH